MRHLPTFEASFLTRICRQIERRRKALKHFGTLTWETTQPDEFEWLNVYFKPFVGHYCVFQFVEDNRVSVFVRKCSRSGRGKLLLEIEDITVVDNAEALVNAIETTIRHSTGLVATSDTDSVSIIQSVWKDLEVRAISSLDVSDKE